MKEMLVIAIASGLFYALNVRKFKSRSIWAVCLLVMLYSAHQNAQPFADDKMLRRLSDDYNVEAKRRAKALNDLITDLENKDVKYQLTEVNRFFNQFRYEDDMELWGKEDYWATPEEFIGINAGDCEDYVVAKYFVLRSLGVSDKQLYLTYVKALKENRAHMVLSYFSSPTTIPLILDNYNPRILPADQRRDLLPVYSFNAESLFLTNASAGLGQSLPTDKIKNNKWKELLGRINRSQ